MKVIPSVAAIALTMCIAVPAMAQRYHRDRDEWRPGPDWDRTIEVHCASEGYHYNMCQIDTGRGSDVRIARQISDTRCVRGRTWGWNRAGIWVDRGCEAVFRVHRRWR